MNELIKNQVEQFDLKMAELSDSFNTVINDLCEEFRNVFNEVYPIIEVMRKHKIYFKHPDLPEDVGTLYGPIVGRNRRNNSEIFVLRDGVRVYAVNVYNNSIDDKNPIILSNFLRGFDAKFAWAGLNNLYSCLDKVISDVAVDVSNLADVVDEIRNHADAKQRH